MITTDQLTMGVLFPIEAFEGPVPRMNKDEQIALAQQAEDLGFDSLWVRDVPLFDPNFRDVGQIYDPWVYMAHIATLTNKILVRPVWYFLCATRYTLPKQRQV